MKSLHLNLILLFIIPLASLAQNCTVDLAAINSSYTGDCKKGKADGKGKATGTDIYEGEFKNGKPDGSGVYTWANGNHFSGNWKNGLKNGSGMMVYKAADGKDSVISGFWKKDSYLGLYEKPYIIHSRTIHVTNISIKKIDETKDQFEIFLDSETGNIPTSITAANPITPQPEITNLDLVQGNYLRRIDNTRLAKKLGYLYEEVIFPFRGKFTIGNNDIVDIEILEAGKWVIDIRTSY